MHPILKSKFVVIFVAGLILSLPSLINGLPFLFVDSTYYINHGHVGIGYWSFLWRPMTYSLLVGYISRTIGILPFIFLQNLFVAWALHLMVSALARRNVPRIFLITVALSYLTPLPIYSNFLLPDIFTGLLAIFVFCLITKKSKVTSTLAFVFSVTSHFSNLLTSSVLPLLFWKSKKMRVIFITALAAWILLPSVHYFAMGNFTVSNVANAIIFSRLAHTGIHNEVLDEECAKGVPLLMCQHRQKPFSIWDNSPDSLVTQLGGIHNLAFDFRYINRKALLSKDGLPRLLMYSMGNILIQATSFFDNIQPIFESEIIGREIQWTQVMSLEDFKTKNRLAGFFKNFGHSLSLVHGLALLFSLIYLGRILLMSSGGRKFRLFFVIAISIYLFNAFFCGLLTDPSARYSSRVSWIFFLLASVHFLSQKYSLKKLMPVESMSFEKGLLSGFVAMGLVILLIYTVITRPFGQPVAFSIALISCLICMPPLPELGSLRSRLWLPLGAFLVSAGGIRLWGLSDAPIYLHEFIQLWRANDIGLEAAAEMAQTPLSYVFSQLGFTLFGHSTLAPRVFPWLWGTLCCGVFFLLCHQYLKSQRVVFGACLLLLTSPWLIHYSQLGHPVSLSVLSAILFTTALHFHIKNPSPGKVDQGLLFIFTGLLAYSDFPSGLLYIFAANLMLLPFHRTNLSSLNAALKLQAFALLFLIPDLLRAIDKSGALNYHIPAPIPLRLTRYFEQLFSLTGSLLIALTLLSVVAAKVSNGSTRWKSFYWLGVSMVFLLLSCLLTDLDFSDIHNHGRLLLLVPCMILGIGVALESILSTVKNRRLQGTFVIIAFALIIAGTLIPFNHQVHQLYKGRPDWKGVYSHINSHAQTGDIVLLLNLLPDVNGSLGSLVAPEVYLKPELKLHFPTPWSDLYQHLYFLDLLSKRSSLSPNNIFFVVNSSAGFKIPDSTSEVTATSFSRLTIVKAPVENDWTETTLKLLDLFSTLVPLELQAEIYLKRAQIPYGSGNLSEAVKLLEQMKDSGLEQRTHPQLPHHLRRRLREAGAL